MKRIALLLSIIMLLAAGCSNRKPTEKPLPEFPKDGSQPGSIIVQESGSEDANTSATEKGDIAESTSADYEQLINKLSIYRLDDFAKASDIQPDQLVTYFFHANYDGEDKLPIPEGYRQDDGFTLIFPHSDVENFIEKYLGVPPQTLADAASYTERGYEVPSMGLGSPAAIRVTEVDDSTPTAVKVKFEVDLTIPDGDTVKTISPAVRRELTLNVQDTTKIVSLKTTYTAQMG